LAITYSGALQTRLKKQALPIPGGLAFSLCLANAAGLVLPAPCWPTDGKKRILRWIKARVGFVSEDMALYGAATLAWHMRLVRDMHVGWDQARALDLLDRFHLDPDQPVRGLSRGQQVKALLLLAMARHADVLVLD